MAGIHLTDSAGQQEKPAWKILSKARLNKSLNRVVGQQLFEDLLKEAVTGSRLEVEETSVSLSKCLWMLLEMNRKGPKSSSSSLSSQQLQLSSHQQWNSEFSDSLQQCSYNYVIKVTFSPSSMITDLLHVKCPLREYHQTLDEAVINPDFCLSRDGEI